MTSLSSLELLNLDDSVGKNLRELNHIQLLINSFNILNSTRQSDDSECVSGRLKISIFMSCKQSHGIATIDQINNSTERHDSSIDDRNAAIDRLKIVDKKRRFSWPASIVVTDAVVTHESSLLYVFATRTKLSLWVAAFMLTTMRSILAAFLATPIRPIATIRDKLARSTTSRADISFSILGPQGYDRVVKQHECTSDSTKRAPHLQVMSKGGDVSRLGKQTCRHSEKARNRKKQDWHFDHIEHQPHFMGIHGYLLFDNAIAKARRLAIQTHRPGSRISRGVAQITKPIPTAIAPPADHHNCPRPPLQCFHKEHVLLAELTQVHRRSA